MTSQALLDLAWAIEGPSFVQGADVAPVAALDVERINVGHLERFIAERTSHRVGYYFEALVHYWLAHVRSVEMIGTSIQILDGKRTVGELDFVYRDEHGVVTHCEAAVKFFLHHPRPGLSHYPGPNASDDYERKTTKLFDRQLPLSDTYRDDIGSREAFVRGQVFYHPDVGEPHERPDRMPSTHHKGVWFRSHEVESHLPHGVVGCIVEKPHWLAPQVDANLSPTDELTAQLRTHFAQRNHPVMVSLRSPDDRSEVERLFVVADDWCDQT